MWKNTISFIFNFPARVLGNPSLMVIDYLDLDQWGTSSCKTSPGLVCSHVFVSRNRRPRPTWLLTSSCNPWKLIISKWEVNFPMDYLKILNLGIFLLQTLMICQDQSSQTFCFWCNFPCCKKSGSKQIIKSHRLANNMTCIPDWTFKL